MFRYPDLLNRLDKLLETISCDGYPSYLSKLVSAGFSDPTSVLSDDFFALKNPSFDFLHGVYDFRNVMMVCDLEHYLEGDILTKVDRASMSSSLETRLLFLIMILSNGLLDYQYLPRSRVLRVSGFLGKYSLAIYHLLCSKGQSKALVFLLIFGSILALRIGQMIF